MRNISIRALRVYTVLENYRDGSLDPLEGILPFFEPSLHEINGQIFVPAELAAKVNSAYQWDITPDVIEELIPRFVEKGWLNEVQNSSDAALYRVAFAELPEQPLENEAISALLDDLTAQFQKFVSKISPLTGYAKENIELADILIEWLVSIDAYSEDILEREVKKAENKDGKISLNVNIEENSSLSSDDKYLCARFVRSLIDENSPHVPSLCKIASVGLLTEVVQDFCKPTSKVEKVDLAIYLDGPIALDLLGVSGNVYADNIRQLIGRLSDLGVSIRVFEATLSEMSMALNAVLARPLSERTGPTAEALRKKEVITEYVRKVAANPGKHLKDFGVGVVKRKLADFPNQHHYFDNNAMTDFMSKIGWHLELPPKVHDAEVFTHIIRMRSGSDTPDLFQSKHLLITKNAMLSQLAKKYSIQNGIMEKGNTPPIIHQRMLATAIWLRTGKGIDADDVPKSQILSACERVLAVRPPVLQRTKDLAAKLNEETARQMELLLSESRSLQLLQDRTLNHSHVITQDNIESLFIEMKAELISEERTKARDILRYERSKSRKKIHQKTQELHDSESARAEMSFILSEREREELSILRGIAGDVKKRSQIYRNILRVLTYGFIIFGFFSMLVLEIVEKNRLYYISLFIFLGILSVFLQELSKEFFLSKFLATLSKAQFRKRLQQAHMLHLQDRFVVEWNAKKFMIEVSPKQEILNKTLLV